MLEGEKPGLGNLVSQLRVRMQWHEARQRVLAHNVAHADTPGYRTRDLEQLDFKRLVSEAGGTIGADKNALVATNAKHMSAMPGDTVMDNTRYVNSFEMTPEGNAVVLEEEVMKTTQNQMEFQMVSTLYSKMLGFVRIATRR